MYIKQLEFENFRRFKHLKMDLPFDEKGNPLPVVLIGVNGSGKSSVLEGITKIVKYAYRNTDLDDYKSIDHLFSRNDLRIGNEDFFQTVSFSLKIVIYSNQYKLIATRPFSGKSKFSSDGLDISRYFIEHRPLYKLYPINRNVVLDERSEPKSISKDFFYSNSFNNSVINYGDFINWFEERENFENQRKLDLKNFDEVDKSLARVRKSIVDILEYLPNANFSNLRFSREDALRHDLGVKKRFVIDKDDTTFEISQLSGGEKMLLMLIGDISRLLSVSNIRKGIVLIDEIELHLHPSWQRVIVNALHEVFPTIQFIVTTHSPLVISHVPQESVFVLDENTEVTSMAQRPFNSYGADIEDVLKMAQGLKETLPDNLQRKFDQYFKLIDDNQIAAAKELQQEIEKMTDRQHPELVKGRALIDFKEIMAE